MFELTWSNRNPKVSFNDESFNDESYRNNVEVDRSAIFLWEEHCMECSPPACYDSCVLYVERKDKKCARFENGIVANFDFRGLDGFGAEIRFRRWAKLQTFWVDTPKMLPLKTLSRLTKCVYFLDKIVSKVSDFFSFLSPKRRLNGFFRFTLLKFLVFFSRGNNKYEMRPDAFWIRFYAPSAEVGALFFELVSSNYVTFRRRIPIKEGWNNHFICWKDLSTDQLGVNLARLWLENDQVRTIVFTHLHAIKFSDKKYVYDDDQVLFAEKYEQKTEKVKCVVFDLDNTIWDGIIGDDGIQGVVVRQSMLDLVHALDARGILCSISSKNDFEIAAHKIKELNMTEYFLFPQINWEPKPVNIFRIAKSLNIGINSIAFIDDNESERDLVRSAIPQVRVFSDSEALHLLNHPDFIVPITEESSKRRLLYIDESKRINDVSRLKVDLDSFLALSEMELNISFARYNFARCHELVMRTNQFNISGKKYSIAEFENLIDSNDCFCWSVKDNYGDYGIVGFVRTGQFRDGIAVLDFVMSCRVAEKRIEETIFNSLVRGLCASKNIYFPFSLTGRNKPLLSKLFSLGATVLEEDKDFKLLILDGSVIINGGDIIRVLKNF